MSQSKPIQVLVVEDSPVVREFLVHCLERDPALSVIGTAENGEQAIEFLEQKKPDIITMDVHMPRMDGFETTRTIMETRPTPVIIVTATVNTDEVATTFRAMEAGALAILRSPSAIGCPDHEKTVGELIQTVKSMSEVKVIRRWPRARNARGLAAPTIPEKKNAAEIRVIGIGASTGGPIVLQTILSALPANFSAPILVVQHMSPGFVDGFVTWLGRSTRLRVQVASEGEPLLEGHVYVAPDCYHMGVNSNGTIFLQNGRPENGLRPSVSFLFRSLAEVFGKRALGILLTGMGRDGADELKLLREAGAITIAQDEKSCVVNGMPGEAVKLEAATYVFTPEKIAETLSVIVKKS